MNLTVRLTDKGRDVWTRNEKRRAKVGLPLTGIAATKTLEIYQDSTTPPVDDLGRVWVRCPFDGAGFAPLQADEWEEVSHAD